MNIETEDTIRKWLKEGELPKAEEMLKKKILENPNDDKGYLYMGHLYRQKNNFQQALQFYAQAIEINPSSQACAASEMIMDILQFYDKERYNV